MKKTRFSEEQIAFALRLGDSGTPLAEVCRQIGISEATFYVWKKKYAALGVAELRRLKMLEDENARLKRIVADLTLDRQLFAGGGAQKAPKPLRRRELAGCIRDALPGERAARLSSGDAQALGLVLQKPGARPAGTAHGVSATSP